MEIYTTRLSAMLAVIPLLLLGFHSQEAAAQETDTTYQTDTTAVAEQTVQDFRMRVQETISELDNELTELEQMVAEEAPPVEQDTAAFPEDTAGVAQQDESMISQDSLADLRMRLDSLRMQVDELAATEKSQLPEQEEEQFPEEQPETQAPDRPQDAQSREQQAGIITDLGEIEEDIRRYSLYAVDEQETFTQDVDTTLARIDSDLDELQQMIQGASPGLMQPYNEELSQLREQREEVRMLTEEISGTTTMEQFQQRMQEVADAVAKLDAEVTTISHNLALDMAHGVEQPGI